MTTKAPIMPTVLLAAHGYRYAGNCRCDGYFTDKFRKGNVEIRVRKTKYVFKVRQHGATLYTFQPLTNLEKVLNELAEKPI